MLLQASAEADPSALLGDRSMAKGGLWPAGRASRRDAGGDGTTATVATGKGVQEGRQMTAKVVAHSVGSEKAQRWKNDSSARASPLGNGGLGHSSAQSDWQSEKRQRE